MFLGGKMNKQVNFRRYIALAMFAALAYASLFVLRIGGIGGFLTFDIKDAIIASASMMFGPQYGVLISFIVALVEMISVSGTGPWGALMNFSSSAVFAAVGSLLYRYMPGIKRTLAGAIVGLCGSVIAMTGVMLILNLLVTPIYMNVPVAVVKDLLLPLLLPFNLVKAMLNAAVVLVIYKPLSTALKNIKVLDGKHEKFVFDVKTILLLIAGLAIIVGCVMFLIFSLDGTFEWVKK